MALELVTVKARTRGKSPQEFSYQGVGRITEREVMSGKEEQAKNADGTPKVDEQGKPVMVPAPVRREDGSAVTVHDIDASGIVPGTPEGLNEVIELFGKIPAKNEQDTPLQRIIDGALNWYNVQARKAASPVTEQVTEDELTPIVTELVSKGILSEDNVAVWRRNVTSGAKLVEMDRLDYVKMTKEYKKLKAA